MSNNNHESTMKWSVDISQFKPAMQEAERSIKLANSEFKKSVAGMDDWTKSTEGINAKLKQLNEIAEAQRRKVQAVNEQYQEAVKLQGEDSKEAQTLKIQLNNQEAQLANTEKQIKKYNDGVKDAGTATSNTSGDISTFKVALGNLIADGLEKAVSLFKDLYSAFEEYDAGIDIIIKKTGATGDVLAGFESIYNKLNGEIVASQTDIAAAVGEVNTRFGSTGEELEDLASLFLKFASVTDTNVSTAIDSTQKALTAFGLSASDAEAVLNTMTATGQNTGVSMSTLTSGLVNNATAFQEMGLDINQSINFLGKLEKSGVDSSSVLSGLSKALKNATAEGKPLNTALEEIQESVLASNGSISESSEVYDLFGKSGEKLFRAIRDGAVDFTNLDEAIADNTGNIDATYDAVVDAGDEITLVVQDVKSEIGQVIADFLSENKDKIQKAVKTVGQVIKDFLNFLLNNGDKITTVIKGLGAALLAMGASKIISGLKNVNTQLLELGKAKGGGYLTLAKAFPYVAVAAGIGAVGTALYKLAKESINTSHAEYQLTDAEKELAQKVKDNAEEWRELTEAREKAVATINTGADYNAGLLDELSEIVDANGKIKEGYEERASFILTVLNEAYGTELEIVDGILDLDQQTTEEIKKQIELQRQQAILDAYKDEYLEALHNINDQEKDLVKAQDSYNDAAETHNKLLEQKADLEQKALDARGNEEERKEYLRELEEVNGELEINEIRLDTVTETLKECKDAYATSENTIKNYEDATGAVASGAADASEKLDDLQNDVRSLGSEELATEVYNNAKTTGINMLAGIQKGAETGWSKLKNYLIDLGKKSVDAINEGAEINSPSRLTMLTGKYLDMGIEQGAEQRAKTTRGKLAYLGQSFAESLNASKNSLNGANAGLNTPVNAGTGQVINFNQTINSPTAPTRLSIYRDTNSLLFGAGVKLNGV